MIELVFVACMATASDECMKQSLLYTDMSPMACMVAAQSELAKWTESHPNFRIEKWHCAMVDLSKHDA